MNMVVLRSGVSSIVVFMTTISGLAWLALDDESGSEMPISAPPTERLLAFSPKSRILRPMDYYRAIHERPLFTPTRRPRALPAPAAPQPEAASVEPPPAALVATLVGVMISPKSAAAMLKMADGDMATVRTGETLNGWTLKNVSKDGATFGMSASTLEMSFPTHQQGALDAIASLAQQQAPIRRRR